MQLVTPSDEDFSVAVSSRRKKHKWQSCRWPSSQCTEPQTSFFNWEAAGSWHLEALQSLHSAGQGTVPPSNQSWSAAGLSFITLRGKAIDPFLLIILIYNNIQPYQIYSWSMYISNFLVISNYIKYIPGKKSDLFIMDHYAILGDRIYPLVSAAARSIWRRFRARCGNIISDRIFQGRISNPIFSINIQFKMKLINIIIQYYTYINKNWESLF